MTLQPSEKPVFPPHIAKYIDVAIIVVDGRAPLASLSIPRDISARPFIVISHPDLAAPPSSGAFVEHFKALGYEAAAVDLTRPQSLRPIAMFLSNAADKKLEERRRRGIEAGVLRTVVLGVPNTGKSTLINALVGRRATRVGNRPGVTRGHQWIRILEGVDLLDTPGIVRPSSLVKRRKLYWHALNLIPLDTALVEATLEMMAERLEAGMDVFPPRRSETKAQCAILNQAVDAGSEREMERTLRWFQAGKHGRYSLEWPSNSEFAAPQ